MGSSKPHFLDRADLCHVMRSAERKLRKHIAERIGNGLKTEIEVDDILQETYFETFETIGKLFFSSEYHLENWMMKVAKNRIWDRIKARSRLKRGGPVPRWSLRTGAHPAILEDAICEGTDPPSKAMDRQEIVLAVRNAVEKLPWAQRTAMRLHLDQVSVSDIAKSISKSDSAVRSLLSQGKKALRREFHNPGDFFSDSGIFFIDRPPIQS
jgi:RNA polymerase sigma factor (sigma-70 family)